MEQLLGSSSKSKQAAYLIEESYQKQVRVFCAYDWVLAMELLDRASDAEQLGNTIRLHGFNQLGETPQDAKQEWFISMLDAPSDPTQRVFWNLFAQEEE